jgi:hypothetical protein
MKAFSDLPVDKKASPDCSLGWKKLREYTATEVGTSLQPTGGG